MARKSTGKWVARAASTGGGRTYRGQAPVNWYLSLVVICILGIASVVYSRYELQHPSNASSSKQAPAIGTKWYEAFGFDICGTVEPNLPSNPPLGKNAASPQIFTASDGLIHVAPTTSAYAGANATLGHFVSLYKGMVLTANSIRYPGGRLYRTGERCLAGTPDAGKKGQVQVRVWSSPTSSTSSVVSGNPGSLKLQDGQMIEMAFLPKGAVAPKPPAEDITTLLKTLAGTSSTSAPTTAPTTPTTPPTTAPTTATTAPTTATTTSSAATKASAPASSTASSKATTSSTTPTTAPTSTGK